MTVASSTSRNSETKLAEKLRSGDSAAMAEFYNLYRNRLYSLVLEQVDRDETIAEDLVHEVFLAALSSLDKFRGDMPVLAISQIMGRSPKSVEGLLSRARKAMRDNLETNNHEG
jgi:DNA-directed RNA polymerase specialized sigma24 family protein